MIALYEAIENSGLDFLNSSGFILVAIIINKSTLGNGDPQIGLRFSNWDLVQLNNFCLLKITFLMWNSLG